MLDRRWARVLGFLGLGMGAAGSVLAAPDFVLVADKKAHVLHAATLQEGQLTLGKAYPMTVGRVVGDKVEESDLKTPEGVYLLLRKVVPPELPAKYGVMAFVTDFPNAFDRLAGRTGYGIMLHGTNEPERLSKSYDSEGCVVLRNELLSELDPKIQAEATRLLIFEDWKAYDPAPHLKAVKRFVKSWLRHWESGDLAAWRADYHPDTVAAVQGSLAAQVKGASHIRVRVLEQSWFVHPKYAVITLRFTDQRRRQHGDWMPAGPVGTKTFTLSWGASRGGRRLGPQIVAETLARDAIGGQP